MAKVNVDEVKRCIELLYMSYDDFVKAYPDYHLSIDNYDAYLIGLVRSALMFAVHGEDMYDSKKRERLISKYRKEEGV